MGDHFENFPIKDKDVVNKLLTHQCRHYDKILNPTYRKSRGRGFYVTNKELHHLRISHKDIERNNVQKSDDLKEKKWN